MEMQDRNTSEGQPLKGTEVALHDHTMSGRYDQLIQALGDCSMIVQSDAKSPLVKLGQAAVPALIGALNYRSEAVRYNAARVLGRIGPEAKEAVPALIGALNDGSETVRYNAAWALGRIGAEAVPALIEALKAKRG